MAGQGLAGSGAFGWPFQQASSAAAPPNPLQLAPPAILLPASFAHSLSHPPARPPPAERLFRQRYKKAPSFLSIHMGIKADVLPPGSGAAAWGGAEEAWRAAQAWAGMPSHAASLRIAGLRPALCCTCACGGGLARMQGHRLAKMRQRSPGARLPPIEPPQSATSSPAHQMFHMKLIHLCPHLLQSATRSLWRTGTRWR